MIRYELSDYITTFIENLPYHFIVLYHSKFF